MVHDLELDELLEQTAQIKLKTGKNYGKLTYGEGTEIKIYWEDKYQTIINREGQEVVSQGWGMILPEIEIEAEDKIITPYEKGGIIINILLIPDPEGNFFPHHKEVYI